MIRYYKKILLLCLSMTVISGVTAFAAATPAGKAIGKLSGQIMTDGKKPLSNARLFIYNKAMGPPSSDRYARVPDQIIYLDNYGRFLLELAPGTYYLSAINVTADAPMGPPADGEPIYFRMDAKGAIAPFVVTAGKLNNVGVITTSAPFMRTLTMPDKNSTLVEGIITDDNGVPVEGAVILADNKPGIRNKALFVSERTSRDGKFILQLYDGGEYFLRVRGEYHGGAPNEGDIVNLNDPKEQIAITLKKGERLSGVTIKVKRQPEKGPLYQGEPKQ